MKLVLALLLVLVGCAPATEETTDFEATPTVRTIEEPTPTPTAEPTPTPTPVPPAIVVEFIPEDPTPTPTPEAIARRNQSTPPPPWLVEAMRTHARPGWDETQLVYWGELIFRESGYDPTAQNPRSTAYGVGQFLNPTSACPANPGTPACYNTWALVGCNKTSDGVEQVRCMALYIEQSYGTPSNAIAYHNRNGSY